MLYVIFETELNTLAILNSRPGRLAAPETPTKRQATQHSCLPSLLGDGDEGIEKVYGEENNILYWAD
jgi:hypothetical protein